MASELLYFMITHQRVFQFIGVFLAHFMQVVLLSFLLNQKKKLSYNVLVAALVTAIFMAIATAPVIIQLLGVFGWNSLIMILTAGVYLMYFRSVQKRQVKLFLLAFTFTYASYYLSDFILSYLFITLLARGPYIGYVFIIPNLLTALPMSLFYLMCKKIKLNELFAKIMQFKLIVWTIFASLLIITGAINYLVNSTMVAFSELFTTGDVALLDQNINESLVVFFIACSVTVSLVWFSTYLFMHMEKVRQQENELIQQQLYIQKLENLQSEMKTFRHDYKNVISSIYLQSKEGDVSSIQTYLSSTMNLLDEQVGSGIMLSSQLVNLKVAEVKSLLLVKIMALEEEKIAYTLQIPYVIEKIAMSTNDFTRCLGILLDNALEEVRNQKQGTVHIQLTNESGELHVVVKNSLVEKPLLQKIWQEGYSTKGANRGLGLSSYQRILARYEAAFKQTLIEEHEFIQLFKIGGKLND
ncbi:hypothetical protein BAU15_08285 [Enterococcus sp. JM4C]|uniref:sensor histidine kinase n=1 Tax=Candidatus Enterococcus huntleyi TaxID=1857217 RepID=UPI001379FDB4|nr:GHKL domain-containing protein [Enterococcus sp. JM4C]KAF1297893.1 hypothetical protein BAU15_08285 [Enterococcus sp. JM4C]